MVDHYRIYCQTKAQPGFLPVINLLDLLGNNTVALLGGKVRTFIALHEFQHES